MIERGVVVGTDDTPVTANTITTLFSYTVKPGTYIIIIGLRWNGNNVGIREIGYTESYEEDLSRINAFRDSTWPTTSDTVFQNLMLVNRVNTETKFDIRCRHTATSPLYVRTRLTTVQIA